MIGKARVLVKRAGMVHQVNLVILDQVVEDLGMEIQGGQKESDTVRGKFWTALKGSSGEKRLIEYGVSWR